MGSNIMLSLFLLFIFTDLSYSFERLSEHETSHEHIHNDENTTEVPVPTEGVNHTSVHITPPQVVQKNKHEHENKTSVKKESNKKYKSDEIVTKALLTQKTTPLNTSTKPPTTVSIETTTKEIQTKADLTVDDGIKDFTRAGAAVTAPQNYKVGPTYATAIAGGLSLTIFVVAYVGLMLWRRALNQTYGNSVYLMDEEILGDMDDEDLRHFEAACIQINT